MGHLLHDVLQWPVGKLFGSAAALGFAAGVVR